jgi:hypothetical protein
MSSFFNQSQKNSVMKIVLKDKTFFEKKHGMDMVALELIKNLQDLDHEMNILFCETDEDRSAPRNS